MYMLNHTGHLLPSPCFSPDPSPVNPTRAAAIAVPVKIYRGVPANSEPGKFKVLRQLGRRERKGEQWRDACAGAPGQHQQPKGWQDKQTSKAGPWMSLAWLQSACILVLCASKKSPTLLQGFWGSVDWRGHQSWHQDPGECVTSGLLLLLVLKRMLNT